MHELWCVPALGRSCTLVYRSNLNDFTLETERRNAPQIALVGTHLQRTNRGGNGQRCFAPFTLPTPEEALSGVWSVPNRMLEFVPGQILLCPFPPRFPVFADFRLAQNHVCFSSPEKRSWALLRLSPLTIENAGDREGRLSLSFTPPPLLLSKERMAKRERERQ